MDPLSQIVLGGTVAGLAAPARHRRKAIAAGMVLAVVPDLDVFPLALTDPVTEITWHRGPSHSLPVLAVFGWLLWLVLRRYWEPVRDAPLRALAAIQLALLTHPLLDAFTIYGTQLLWPLPTPPVMWSSIFIIDPLYTLPLLAGCIGALSLSARPGARAWLVAGFALSSSYLAWTLFAKAIVEHAAERALIVLHLEDEPRFSVPTPFNTLLWRVVVRVPGGYLEGERSLVADRGPMRFTRYDSDDEALAVVSDVPAMRRLDWFTHGFLKAEEHDGQLVLSDLRMGAEPNYSFSYAVATRDEAGAWQPMPVERFEWPDVDMRGELASLWQRIWRGTEGARKARDPAEP